MDNNTSQKNNKIKNILEKIQKNELTSRSKTFFRLKLVALIIVVVAVCIVSVFLASFVLFTLRASGHASLIGFGPRGWQVFLLLFPWKLCIVAIILVTVLERLLRSFRFGYKVPVLYLLAGVFGLMVVSGFVIDTLRLHDDLLRIIGENRLPPPFGRLYEGARRPPPPPQGHGIFRGVVSAVGTTTLQVDVDDPRSATTTSYSVVLPKDYSLNSLTIGDHIFISGKIVNNEIQARDIRKNVHPLMK